MNTPGTPNQSTPSLLVLACAYIWNEYAIKDGWSWVRQFGTTSLLIYWVHIELVYGRWFGPWKERLTNIECAFAAAAVMLLMLALSVTRTRWKSLPFANAFHSFASRPPRELESPGTLRP